MVTVNGTNSRSMVAAMRAFCFVAIAGLTSAASAADQGNFDKSKSCLSGLDIRQTVEFQGQELRVAPDLDAPELRKIDAVIDRAECLNVGAQLLAQYAEKNPDDYRVLFLKGRMEFMTVGYEPAVPMLEKAIQEHPTFSSAKVLLASIALFQFKYDVARPLLNDLSRESPNDLWAFIDRQKLALFSDDGRSSARKILLAIMRNSSFPSAARESAGYALTEQGIGSDAERESAYRELLQIPTKSTYREKALDFAPYLIETPGGRYSEARTVLKPIFNPGNPSDPVNVFMAEAWLLEASSIDPTPTPRNKTQRDAALVAVDGDFSNVNARIAARPYLARINPFLRIAVDPNTTDNQGFTQLCNGVRTLNEAIVQLALDGDADPNASCDKRPPLVLLVWELHGNPPEKVQAVARLLLARGADPDLTYIDAFGAKAGSAIEFCLSGVQGCETVLYPLYKQYSKQASSK